MLHMFILVNRPGINQALKALLLNLLLPFAVKIADFYGQRSPHKIQKDLGYCKTNVRRGQDQCRMTIQPVFIILAKLCQGSILNVEKVALLQIGKVHSPSAF